MVYSSRPVLETGQDLTLCYSSLEKKGTEAHHLYHTGEHETERGKGGQYANTTETVSVARKFGYMMYVH